MDTTKWIWQHENFSHFVYDYPQLEPAVFRLVEKSGELKGKMSYLTRSEHDLFSVETLMSEIVSTSLIEGMEWFESIHPYDDGNGRIGRAIVNYILARNGGLDNRYYSISTAINEDRRGYHDTLERNQKVRPGTPLDITLWIVWHTRSIECSIEISLQTIENIVEKTRFYDKIRHIKLNDKQNKAINKRLGYGAGHFEEGLTNKKYRALTRTDAVTASCHLKDLVTKGILRPMEGYSGRNTRYELAL